MRLERGAGILLPDFFVGTDDFERVGLPVEAGIDQRVNPTSATGVAGGLAELILLGFWRSEGQRSPLHRPGLSWLGAG